MGLPVNASAIIVLVCFAAMVDTCSPNHRDNGWSLGIETMDELTNSDPRWFFKLGTDRAPHPTTIYSFMPYQNGQWVDLTATYDTQQMSLYVNGVRVASSAAQRGIMFHPFTRGCKDIVVGGVTQKVSQSDTGIPLIVAGSHKDDSYIFR